MLATKSCQIYEVRQTPTKRMTTTIQWLLNKKASNTLQEEQHWLRVQLKDFDRIKLNLFLGCSHCSANTNADRGETYTCHACFKKDVISTPRMNITFQAKDETGCYLFSAFNKNAELILHMDASDLYSMATQEREKIMIEAEMHFTSNPVYIQVAPTIFYQDTADEFIMWVLRKVSLT